MMNYSPVRRLASNDWMVGVIEHHVARPLDHDEVMAAVGDLKRLQELEVHVQAMFDTAAEDGLYIGSGKNIRLQPEEQEGPMVKELRKLARVK